MRADPDPLDVGSGVAHWGSLHDAWQAKLLACPRAADVRKEHLPAAVIIAIVEHRMKTNGAPHDTLDIEPGPRRCVATLHSHARDAQGRNWDVTACDTLIMAGPGGEGEFRGVVDALRDQFDIA